MSGDLDSATGLARRLEVPRQRLHHPLHELERWGLVVLVEERPRRSFTERALRAGARCYVLSPEILGQLGTFGSQDLVDPYSWASLAAGAARTLSQLARRRDAAEDDPSTLTVPSRLRFASTETLRLPVAWAGRTFYNQPMGRFFNVAGMCRPEKHYMVESEARLARLRPLIEREAYFVIHAPRQSGKTTTTRLLAEALTAEGRYAGVLASCKPGSTAGDDVERGVGAVLQSLDEECQDQLPAELRPPSPAELTDVVVEARLRRFLRLWCKRCPRPVVLFLDEIDSLVGKTLLSVLDQLHAAYPNRPGGAPHALALIGLRDVRDYKMKRDGTKRAGSASPFNIKSHSLTLRNFTAEEVDHLYGQHTAETGQAFSEEARARAWELTRGQPWLVNAMAALLVDELVTDRSEVVEAADVEVAKEVLIRRRDTHVDSLLERLREQRVRNVIEPILTGHSPMEEVFNDDLLFVKDLGLVAPGRGTVEIANPIYREIIPRALTEATEAFLPIRRAAYIAEDGRLLWNDLLDGFMAYWKENAEWMLERQPYSEAASQLVFSAWLHRIVNGGAEVEARPAGVAAIDREYAVGSGRVDLLVRWPLPEGGVKRFAAELKVRRDKDGDPLDDGLEQISEYLDRLGLDEGTLVLFDQRSDAPPITERCSRREKEHGGRRITVLRL